MVLLRGSWYFFNLATRKKVTHQFLIRIFPWLEVSIWAAFAFWAINFNLSDNRSYFLVVSALAIVLIAVLGWFVIKDFIAGAVLRSDMMLEKGMQIKTDLVMGTIVSLGYLSMGVKTQSGDVLIVPYNKLSNKSVSKITEKSHGKSNTIRVLIPEHHSIQNIEKQIRKKMLEMPWIIAANDIKFEMLPRDNYYEAVIHFFSIREDMFTYTDETIQSFVKKLVEN
jgi:small-conductance mechanosensitive channel